MSSRSEPRPITDRDREEIAEYRADWDDDNVVLPSDDLELFIHPGVYVYEEEEEDRDASLSPLPSNRGSLNGGADASEEEETEVVEAIASSVSLNDPWPSPTSTTFADPSYSPYPSYSPKRPVSPSSPSSPREQKTPRLSGRSTPRGSSRPLMGRSPRPQINSNSIRLRRQPADPQSPALGLQLEIPAAASSGDADGASSPSPPTSSRDPTRSPKRPLTPSSPISSRSPKAARVPGWTARGSPLPSRGTPRHLRRSLATPDSPLPASLPPVETATSAAASGSSENNQSASTSSDATGDSAGDELEPLDMGLNELPGMQETTVTDSDGVNMIPAEMDDASYALALSLWTAEVDDEERLARETERAVAASWEDIASREIASEGESSDEEESEEQKHRRTQLAADALQRYRAEIESRMRGLNTTVPPPLGSDIQDDPVDAPEPAASPSHPNSPPNPTPHSETVPAGPAPHSETEPSSPGPHADSDHRHCPDHHCHDHHHSSHQPSPEQVERDLRPASRPPGEPIFRAGYRDHERQHELEMRDKERQRKKKEREDEEAEAEKQSQMAMVQVQRTTIAESSRKGKGKAKAVEDEAEEEEEEDAEALPSDGDDDEDEDQPSAPKGKRIPPTKGKSRTVTTVASRLGRRKRTRLVIRSPRPRREQQGPDAGNSDAAGSSGVGVESDGSSGNAAETCGRPPGPSCSFHAGHDWDPETDDNESDADWDAQWKDDSDWGDDGAGDDDGLDMNGDADDDDDAGEGWETERDEEEEDRPFTIDVTRCAHCGKTKQQLTGGKLRGLYGRTGERRHICSACCRRKNRDWKTFLLEHRFLEKRSVVDRTAWEHTFADRWVEAANCRTTEIAVKIKGPFARHLHEQQRIEVNRQKRAEIQSTQSCEVDECKSTELVSRFGALGIFCMSHGNRALRLSKRNPLVEPTDLMASFKADAGSFLDRESTYKVMIDGRILQEAEEDKSRCHACPAEVHRWRFLACTNGFRGLCRKHLSRAVLPVYVEQSSYSYFRRRSKLSHSSFVEAPAQGAIASVIATSALSWHWIRCRGCGVRIKHNAAGRSSLGTALDHRHGDPDGINGWLCFPCNTGPLVEYQHCEDTVDWVPKMIADVLALDGGTLLHREKFASWEAPGWISDYQQRSALAAASVPVYWEHSVHMSYLADLKKTVNYGDHPREEACHHCRVTGRPGGGTTHRRNRCMGRTENQAKRLAAMEHDPTNAADAYLESYQRHVVELVTRIPDIAETQPALKRVFDACQEDSDVRAYLATIPAPEEVDAVWMQGLEERMDRSPAVQGAIADLVKDLGAQRMDARTIHRFTFTKNGIRHLPPSDGWHFGRYPAL